MTMTQAIPAPSSPTIPADVGRLVNQRFVTAALVVDEDGTIRAPSIPAQPGPITAATRAAAAAVEATGKAAS